MSLWENRFEAERMENDVKEKRWIELQEIGRNWQKLAESRNEKDGQTNKQWENLYSGVIIVRTDRKIEGQTHRWNKLWFEYTTVSYYVKVPYPKFSAPESETWNAESI